MYKQKELKTLQKQIAQAQNDLGMMREGQKSEFDLDKEIGSKRVSDLAAEQQVQVKLKAELKSLKVEQKQRMVKLQKQPYNTESDTTTQKQQELQMWREKIA